MSFSQNWKKRVSRALMWVLVLIAETASSETWDQNLDLTIPSLEMPLTWQLDSKDKHAIMMGFECCYHNSLLESVQREASIKSIEYKSKVNLKKLQYLQYDERALRSYFIIINSLDVATTYRGLKHPNVIEANPILGEHPAFGELLALKLVTNSLILHLSKDNPEELIFPNIIITFAVINNFDVLDRVGIL